MAINFEQVKAVIWDLDDTLWQGTLTEGDVFLPEMHKETVKFLADAGVINSICSKNDFKPVDEKLQMFGIRDFFVFPSIDWTPKGPRVKQLIIDLQLRPQNILFIDDNHLNREEVRFHCPEIMVTTQNDIEALHEEAKSNKSKDSEHSRLKQYQILEAKNTFQREFSSNEEFLLNSAICVKIDNECMPELDRIFELVQRTNQLNFTKNRPSRDELIELINSKNITAGYVSVKDRFGDYGITGFFAMQQDKLEHFLFSCRTIGMGVEQYVYNYLGRPKLEIQGEVVSDLSSMESPKWINATAERSDDHEPAPMAIESHSVLMKGPCDLSQIFSFISTTNCIDTEFTYVNPKTGVSIDQISHTSCMVQALTLSKDQKQTIIEELPFSDPNMYSDLMFKQSYRVIFLSILVDANLGIYRRKATGQLVGFGQASYPLTDPDYWPGYLNGEYYNANCKLTKPFLSTFSDKYEFMGATQPEQLTKNILFIRDHLPPECVLVLMLGTELHFEGNQNPAYHNRNLIHKQFNNEMRKLATQYKNIKCLDVNKYINGQESFHHHYNHFKKQVYYNMAKEVAEIIKEGSGVAVGNSGVYALWLSAMRQKAIEMGFKTLQFFGRPVRW